MRLQIEPTEYLVEVDNVPVRVWNGISEHGVQVFVFVHRIAVRSDSDAREFDAELAAMPQPAAVSTKSLEYWEQERKDRESVKD